MNKYEKSLKKVFELLQGTIGDYGYDIVEELEVDYNLLRELVDRAKKTIELLNYAEMITTNERMKHRLLTLKEMWR